jgi:hypothetical protein
MNMPGSGNYTFETIGSTYRFDAPIRKDWLGIFVNALAVVFVAWIVWPSNLGLLSDGSVQAANVLLLAATGIIAVGLALQVLEIIWQLLGHEVMEVSDDAVIVRHHILGFGPSRRVPVDKVTGLATGSPEGRRGLWNTRRNYQLFNFNRGRVVVSGGRGLLGRPATYRFGTNLDQSEAEQVVGLLLNRFPQYQAKSSAQIPRP